MSLVEWYVARASGMVAFGLLSLAVIAGLTLSGRARLRYWPRFAVEDVHRFLGLLTGTFVGLHVFTLLIDSYMPFSLSEVLIPGAASFRPVYTALGVVAMELMVALAVTNHYRKRLSYRFWRRAHYLNFAVWLLALAHGIADGTDRGAAWASFVYIGSASAVAGMTAWRALNVRPAVAARSN